MANRVMIHRGKVKSEIPEVTERYLDPETGLFEENVIEKAKTIEQEISGHYGDFPIGRQVNVPKQWQGILKKKGFEFVNQKEREAFDSEQAQMDELLKTERDRAFQAAKNAPGGISGQGTDSDQEPPAKATKKKGGNQ